MAELATSLFVAGGAAGSTAAAAGTAAAGTAAALTAPTAGALSALQGTATVASMVATLMGGGMALRQGADQSRVQSLEAEGQRLAAEEKAVRIRREMVQKIGAARVAYGASGVDISGAGATEDALASQAEFETGLALDEGETSRARGMAAASQLRQRGLASFISSIGNAASQYANYRIDLARRGG